MNFEFLSLGRHATSRPASRRTRYEALETRIALTASATTPESLEDIATPLAMDMDPMDPHDMDPSGDFTIYPGGVMVTPTAVITHHDTIPRLAANPTIVSVRSGSWDDPATWSMGRVPVSGDRVSIAEHHTVLLRTQLTVRIDSLEISGTLTYSTTDNTRLLVANVLVLPPGHLRIGTDQQPIAPNVTAELVIADKPLDLVKDPKQFGTGLVGLGEITVHGSETTQTWQKLIAEPKAGDRLLFLSQPGTNWKTGDTLVLPDSRQVLATQDKDFVAGKVSPQWEEVQIQQIFGQVVVLSAPLKFNHPGYRNLDGQLELLPDVALLNRNVVVRSENPEGTRGHILFTARADVDLEYAEFRDLGRTDAMRPLDNTTVDAAGNVTHIGTNQIGRYAIHFHHVIGPENATNTGYQFEVVGNAITGTKKWGLAVHGTSFGLVDRNVVYNGQGSGIVTEDGTEIGNVFSNNITIRMQGTGVDGSDGTAEGDYGRGGVGFWFRRGGNIISGNVAVDNTYAGFVISGYNLTPGRLPLFRGADVHDPSQTVDGSLTPTTLMVDNEAYGMTPMGLWIAFVNGSNLLPSQSPTLIYDMRLWHIHDRAVMGYHTANVTFNQLWILGSMAARNRNDTGPVGMDLRVYESLNTVITNSRIEGMYTGIFAPSNDSSQFGTGAPTIISNSVLRNYMNVLVIPPGEGTATPTNEIEIRNVKFEMVSQVPNWPKDPASIRPSANIVMDVSLGRFTDYTRSSTVKVYDYNQVKGQNFQVFYNEQSPNWLLPKTNPAIVGTRDRAYIGSPEFGLTNAEAWSRYGLAMGGAVAPSNAKTQAGIIGLVAPIQTPPATPKVVFVTPWDGVTISTGYVRVRYNLIGQLPAGAKVFVQLDDRPAVTELPKGGFYNVDPGSHQIRAYIGDASGKPIAGTTVAVKNFTSI